MLCYAISGAVGLGLSADDTVLDPKDRLDLRAITGEVQLYPRFHD